MKPGNERPGQSGMPVPGTVYADAVYRADEFKARMGWREAAFRAACRQGLPCHRIGRRVYVLGADAITFVTQNGGDR